MTEEQIKYMVTRFLGWRLPENFQPDAGISFKAEYGENGPYPGKHQPIGTNLFDASQAEAMVRYMVDGMPPDPHFTELQELVEQFNDGSVPPDDFDASAGEKQP